MVVTVSTQTLLRGTCQMRAIQTLSTVITLVLEWNACKKKNLIHVNVNVNVTWQVRHKYTTT